MLRGDLVTRSAPNSSSSQFPFPCSQEADQTQKEGAVAATTLTPTLAFGTLDLQGLGSEEGALRRAVGGKEPW